MGVFVCAPDFFFSQFNLPNRPWLVAITVAVALTTYAAPSRAQLVINELYYDHPGSDDGHEFVEIMNVSDAVVPLAGVTVTDLVDFDVPTQCIQAGLDIVGLTTRMNSGSAQQFAFGQAGATAPPVGGVSFVAMPTIPPFGPCPAGGPSSS